MAYSFVTTNVPPFDGNSAASDYRLFTAIEENLGDHKFKNDRWVETTVTRWHITQDNDWHQHRTDKVVPRYYESEQCGCDSVPK
jgi:hypothetical protein